MAIKSCEQRRHQPRPAGLVGSAKTGAALAVETFVEEGQARGRGGCPQRDHFAIRPAHRQCGNSGRPRESHKVSGGLRRGNGCHKGKGTHFSPAGSLIGAAVNHVRHTQSTCIGCCRTRAKQRLHMVGGVDHLGHNAMNVPQRHHAAG
jgi:hypothetical protein